MKNIRSNHVSSPSLSAQIAEYLIYFFLYSVLGWIYEVVLEVFIYRWGFSNRGVLFGPYCVIYGFGALILIFSLSGLQKKKIRRWEKNTDWTAEAVKLLLFDKKLTNRQKFTAENRKIYDPTKKMENVLKKMEKSNKAREKGICKKCTNPKCKLQRIKQA